MDYLIAVQAPAYAVSPTTFATESAFAQHLRELRQGLGPKFEKVVLLAPSMPPEEYMDKRQHLGVIDLERDGVAFVPMHRTDSSARQFWSGAPDLWRRIRHAVRSAGIVHSGMASDIWRPLMAMVNLAGLLQRRPVVFVVDIDFRLNAVRSRRLGLWSTKSYAVNRVVYDPLKWMQVWLAPHLYKLVLLKSASLVADFGRGRTNVRNFYDTAHGAADVLQGTEVAERLAWLADPGRPLEIVYFGRLVRYKGLDRAIEAVRLVRLSGIDVQLRLIGEGDCLPELKQMVAAAGQQEAIHFEGAVRYGPPLFERLRSAHLCIATPLLEDTPRAAFDAMARGLPILAFDISYFKDLALESGAVSLAAWPEVTSLAQRIASLDRDRTALVRMALCGLAFAADNTQALWLMRRQRWIEELSEIPQR